MASSSSFAVPTATGGGGGGDHLTTDESLSVLALSFPHLPAGLLADTLRANGYNLEKTYAALDCDVVKPADKVQLEISAELFYALFGQFARPDDDDIVQVVAAKVLSLNKPFLLPLDRKVASAVWRNLVEYVSQDSSDPEFNDTDSDSGRGDSDYGSSCVVSRDASPSRSMFASYEPPLATRTESVESSVSLKEIMDTDAALAASREEYVQDLLQKTCYSIGSNGAVVRQEWMIHNGVELLAAKYPGVADVGEIFEKNGYDYEKTIQEIEERFLLSPSPRGRPKDPPPPPPVVHSVIGDSGPGGPSLSPRKPRSWSVEAPRLALVSETTTTTTAANDVQFYKQVQSLVNERGEVDSRYRKLTADKKKFRSSVNVMDRIQRELAETKVKYDQLNERMVKLFVGYSHPSNCIDLHGLIMKEVPKVVPALVAKKQAELARAPGNIKRVRIKFITGVGHTSGINQGKVREYVKQYFEQQKLSYEQDGPGAFKVSLTRD